jgi:hypothetical protein
MSSPFGSRGAAPQITQIPLTMIPTIAGAGMSGEKTGNSGRAGSVPPLPELPRAPRLEDFVPTMPLVAPPELPPNTAAPQAPALQPTLPMPTMGSRATAAAALRARQAIAAREGRASTLLTTPAMRPSPRAVRPTLAGATSPYARITRG